MAALTQPPKNVASKTSSGLQPGPTALRVSLWWVGLAYMLTGCVSATIQLVDERTALENQIMGSYQQLDQDLQLVASVRAVDAQGNKKKPPQLSRFRNRAIAARQTQQFHLDDVTEYKAQGCLGESNQGLLEIKDCPETQAPHVAKRVERIVADENQARKVLFDFIITTSPDLSKTDQQQLQRVWASMARKKAATGHWIQTEQGDWIQKG